MLGSSAPSSPSPSMRRAVLALVAVAALLRPALALAAGATGTSEKASGRQSWRFWSGSNGAGAGTRPGLWARAGAHLETFRRLSPRAEERARVRRWLEALPEDQRRQLESANDEAPGRGKQQTALLATLDHLIHGAEKARTPALATATLSAVALGIVGLASAHTVQTVLALGLGTLAAVYGGIAVYYQLKGEREFAKIAWGATAGVGLLAAVGAFLPAGFVWAADVAFIGGTGLATSALAWSAHRVAGTAKEARLVVRAEQRGWLKPAEDSDHKQMLAWVDKFAGASRGDHDEAHGASTNSDSGRASDEGNRDGTGSSTTSAGAVRKSGGGRTWNLDREDWRSVPDEAPASSFTTQGPRQVPASAAP